MVLLCFLIALCGLVYLFLNTNNRALYYLKFKRYAKAQELLLKAVENKPFRSLYRMNLAFSYLLSGQHEYAIKEYQSVAELATQSAKGNDSEAKNQTSKFTSVHHYYVDFNSAVAATMQQESERALAFYQKALLYSPHSIEVKTNIELLSKQQKENKKQDQKNPQQQPEDKNKKHSDQGNKNSPQESAAKSTRHEEKSTLPSSPHSLTKGQIESILKSIQDQEKSIKLERDKGQQSPLHHSGKDW